MRARQEIKERIKDYENLKNADYSPLNTPFCNRCIKLLEWVLEGEDIKHQKRNRRIQDRAWYVKSLGWDYMQDKIVHHEGWDAPNGPYCFILYEEEHKRLHGKKLKGDRKNGKK